LADLGSQIVKDANLWKEAWVECVRVYQTYRRHEARSISIAGSSSALIMKRQIFGSNSALHCAPAARADVLNKPRGIKFDVGRDKAQPG